MMATEAQIIANRRNAQKSTGPRTRTPPMKKPNFNYCSAGNYDVLCKTKPTCWILKRGPRKIGLSRFPSITYGLHAKGCYIDTRRVLESYTETI